MLFPQLFYVYIFEIMAYYIFGLSFLFGHDIGAPLGKTYTVAETLSRH